MQNKDCILFLGNVFINQKINYFKKTINISGDKSLSIRWALLASQALGKSRAYNLLKSEDVLSALNAVKKLGINYRINKKNCKIIARGTPSELLNDQNARSAYFGESFKFN